MIKIDYTLRPQDEKELLAFLSDIPPEAFFWQVPNALFTMEVNGVDFSDYHNHQTRTTPVIEFAALLKLYLSALEPRYRALLLHLDGEGALEVYRLNEETILLVNSDPARSNVEVSRAELCSSIDEFCLRLYHEVVVRYREAFEFLNHASSGRLLDQWIDFLMTPGDQLNMEKYTIYVGEPDDFKPF